jgi:hypothetical protein
LEGSQEEAGEAQHWSVNLDTMEMEADVAQRKEIGQGFLDAIRLPIGIATDERRAAVVALSRREPIPA